MQIVKSFEAVVNVNVQMTLTQPFGVGLVDLSEVNSGASWLGRRNPIRLS